MTMNRLNFGQKVRLMEWLREYPTETRTAPIIAEEASQALGFFIKASTVLPILAEIGKKTSNQLAREGVKLPANDLAAARQAYVNLSLALCIKQVYKTLSLPVPSQVSDVIKSLQLDADNLQ